MAARTALTDKPADRYRRCGAGSPGRSDARLRRHRRDRFSGAVIGSDYSDGGQFPARSLFVSVAHRGHLASPRRSLDAAAHRWYRDAARAEFDHGTLAQGDVEQTIQLGAHGPRSVKIILLDEGDRFA